MKKKIPVVLLALVFAAGITSCNSDEGTPVDGLQISTESFSVNMNGENYTAAQVSAHFANNVITIKGMRGSNGEAVTILTQSVLPGTYTNIPMYYTPGIVGVEYSNTHPATGAINGSLVITALQNDKISGAFTFTGYWGDAEPIVFTNGTFKDIPVTHSDPAPVADGTVSANVNGANISFINSYYVQADQNYIINGQNAGNTQILQISLPADIAVGTHAMGGEADAVYANITGGEAGTDVFSVTGTLTITGNNNGVLAGIFTFTGTDADGNPVEVTGEFFVELQ